MDGVQAAVLGVKLPFLDGWNAGRRRAAHDYHEHLDEIGNVQLPLAAPWAEPAWHIYAAQHPDRDALQDVSISGVHASMSRPDFSATRRQSCTNIQLTPGSLN